MQLSPRTRLGPYEIDALLGTGGTGEVYKATDTRLNRNVAIKCLTGPDVDRLEREARVIATMNHPYICSIYDVGDDYLVMEYVEGDPIKGPLPLHECLNLGSQIATALEAAHSQGVVHRDLKPANILVSHGSVKLLDFGHAKQLASGPSDGDPETLAGTVLGTAAYMSPEQVQGQSVDARSDVFSFGVVLYELLSGKRAFDGDTVLDVLNAVVDTEPRPLETTPELQGIVMRCLNKAPAKRFQSMAEVREALTRVQIHKPKEHPSIAVLPFANLSGNKENDYFCEGLTEEIINQLAQIPGLRVTARTSVFVFQKRTEDIRKIAQTLDVQTVLEGSVRESGTRLRVTTQLINAADGYHLWSKGYDRKKADVFEIQDDIAGAIARSLQVRFYHGSTVSIPAYEAYLKARHHLWKLTPEGLAQSREYYEQAITLDPDFALAHSGYADYFLARAILGMVPAEEAMPAARASARKALDIDPSLPDAHAVLATVATLFDLDTFEAERRFGLANSSEAVSSAARVLYAYYYLLPRGRANDAVKELERGLRDDPLNATLHRVLGSCLDATGRTEDASRAFHEALELDEQSVQTMTLLAMDYWARAQPDEALAWAERAYSLTPWNPVPVGLYSGFLARGEEPARASRVLERLGDGRSYGAPLGLALFDVLVGNIDGAIGWVNKLIEQRHVAGVFHLLYSPLGKTLLSSNGWPALARMLQLPGPTP
jgi:serine/threonine protein kinase/Tfp pilus assembly protein PilF